MAGSTKRPQRLRLCFVGWGAITRRTAELLAQRRSAVEIVAVGVRSPERQPEGLPAGVRLLTSADELAGLGVGMVVEAAGRDAVAAWGEGALRHAGAFAVASAAALCDDALLARLVAAAEEHGSRLVVPSGALGDLGALGAASILPLDEVVHAIVKPPRAWRGTEAEQILDLETLSVRYAFFRGSAREAASRYPQNANATVISALSGLGLDRTQVVLVADPAATGNVHEVTAVGDFGSLSLRLENRPLKANPKSSEMTALSLVKLVEDAVAPLLR